MSLAFQKLQGSGTTAFQQLEKLGDLIQGIERLNYPDIYKMARMFAPDVELIPVALTWRIPDTKGGDTVINLDGRYFGIFTISHRAQSVASSNNSWARSACSIYDGSEIMCLTARDTHGDDVLTWGTRLEKYTGYGSSIRLSNTSSMVSEVSVTLIGFKLGDALPAPDITPDNFAFAPKTDVALDTFIEFPYTVQGVNQLLLLSIDEGVEVSINGSAFISWGLPQVQNGDNLVFRLKSSAEHSIETSANVYLGDTTALLKITTLAELFVFTHFPLSSYDTEGNTFSSNNLTLNVFDGNENTLYNGVLSEHPAQFERDFQNNPVKLVFQNYGQYYIDYVVRDSFFNFLKESYLGAGKQLEEVDLNSNPQAQYELVYGRRYFICYFEGTKLNEPLNIFMSAMSGGNMIELYNGSLADLDSYVNEETGMTGYVNTNGKTELKLPYNVDFDTISLSIQNQGENLVTVNSFKNVSTPISSNNIINPSSNGTAFPAQTPDVDKVRVVID